MSKPFEYSVLKYRTSYLLDERVNVGLLFRFRKDDIESEQKRTGESQYVFLFPNSLSRVSHFFPQLVNLNDIKHYLRAFKKQANQLSKEDSCPKESLDKIIQKNFIINDANSFFFSETKFGFYEDIKKTTDYFAGQYFKHFSTVKRDRRDDAYVREQFEKTLKSLANPKDERLLYFKRGFKLEDDAFSTDFEYSWQNGTSNLIKTLNFDLTDVGYIQKKAFQWKAEIDYWEEIAVAKDIRFDILLSKPTKKDLFKPYDHAVSVLEEIDSAKKIIEEEEIKDYAENALNNVKPF